MNKFSMGNSLGPCNRVIPTEDSKIGFNFLIYLFDFSVELRVTSGGEREVIVKKFPKFLCKGGRKLEATIRDYFVEKSEVKEDFVEEKGGDPFCGDRFLDRAENYHLSKSMVDHNQERIKG